MKFKLVKRHFYKLEPTVSISKRRFWFNHVSCEKYNLFDKKFVQIYIATEQNKSIVGFRFLKEKLLDSYNVRSNSNHRGLYCAASSVWKLLNIDPRTYQRYYYPRLKKYKNLKFIAIEIKQLEGE